MANIRLPNGQIAQFPDDMPGDEIKAFIQSKFPGNGEPSMASLLKASTRLQIAQQNAPQQGQVVEGNPNASSLPGPLGNFANTMAANRIGLMEGVTGNFSNEITSGALAIPDAIGSALQGNGLDVGRSFNNLYEYGQQDAANNVALNPAASNAGHVTGSLVMGSSLGGLSPMTRATTPLGMTAMGALEGGTYGALYGFGGAEGNPLERGWQAADDTAMGAVGGGLIGRGASVFTTPVSNEARLLSRPMIADNIDPLSVQGRLAALGNDAVVGDLGPNLQAQTGAVATIPGSGASSVAEALTQRRLMANARIKDDLESVLGPAPRLSQVTGDIDAARKSVNAQYEPVFRAKALSNDPFTDITPIVDSVTMRLSQLPNGETKTALSGVLNRLTDAAGNPIADPQMIMSVRQDLDGLIGSEANRTIKGALQQVRRELDSTLGASVPGLKDIDAQFAEIAGQSDALDTGRTLLRTDQNAVDPADLVEMMATNSAGQNVRLSEGVRAEINRIIGTSANDRVALRGIVRGDGSWNAEKLASVLGQDKADEILRIIDNEATKAATENLATSGSRTQVLRAAQDDLKGNTDAMGVAREAMNLQFGNAAGKVADALLGGAIQRSREGVIGRVGEALVSGGLSPQMQSELVRLTQGLPQNQRSIIAALLASQASTTEQPKPITVDARGSTPIIYR